MSLSRPAWEYILGFADDELLMGHRHSEWLGVAPYLEEDLAFASIAQDELGHARALYGLLGDDVDALAFGRPPEQYRCCWLVELPARRWEDALVRHVLYDVGEGLRWRNLSDSTVEGLPELAAKALREEEYHLRHAGSVLERMLSGTDESSDRLAAALDRVLPFAAGLFEPAEREVEAVGDGVAAESSAQLESRWRTEVDGLFAGSGLVVDWGALAGEGGRRGSRSEHFDEAFAVMTDVLAADPSATW